MRLRKQFIFAGVLLALIGFGVQTSKAIGDNDKSIEEFWTRFKTAVQKQDKASIATMSQFPIEMPYGVAKIRNRTQLIRRYRDLFKTQADAAKCFNEAKPVVDADSTNRFTVGCKDAAGNEVVVYGFVLTNAGWKLKSLDNLNE